MKRKIWITKNWQLAACIMVWFEKPVWHPNKNQPQDRDSGFWCDKDGTLEGGHPLSHDAFKRLFKVSFRKRSDEGFIAERIISVSKTRKGRK